MENIIKPQSPPAIKEFTSLAKEPCNRIQIVAPFITASGVRYLVQALPSKNIEINVCSRFDIRNFSQGSSDFAAFRMLNEYDENWSVHFYNLGKLHAKIFVFDNKCLITSANLTHSGLNLNYEFGLVVSQLNTVEGLKERIDNIFDVAKPISIDEIKAIALSSPKNFTRGFELFNKDEIIEEEIINVNTLDKEPEEEISDTDEIKKIDRVYKFLEGLLEFNREEYPFEKLKIYEFVKGQVISEIKDELSEVVLKDLANVKTYLIEMAKSYGLPEEAREDLFYVFVKGSFINSFCPEIKSKSHVAKQIYYRVYGKKVLELFLAIRLLRSNLLWLEDIGYFVKGVGEVNSWITPRLILEEFGARWCLAFGDLKSGWERDQAYQLLGIISFYNPHLLWGGLAKFIDSSSLYSRGVLFSLDFKSILQEITQEHNNQLPLYIVISETGPDHEKEFLIKVKAFGEEELGRGGSKRLAEQNAAEIVLEKLKRIGKITPKDTVVTRKRKKDIKPYLLTNKFAERLNDFKSLFKFSLPDNLIDCALTSLDERNNARNRRSNEKLSYIGSILRDIMSSRYQLTNFDITADQTVNITKKRYVNNFLESSYEIRHLVEKYYGDANVNELANLVDSIMTLTWFDSRWNGLLKYSEIFKMESNEFIKYVNATNYLQEIIQEKSSEIPEYQYFQKGQTNERSFQCQVSWKGKVLAKSGWVGSKKEARKDSAIIAIDYLKENPSIFIEEEPSESG